MTRALRALGLAFTLALALLALALLACGCATFRPMTAAPDDLEDYRAFRVAAYEGTRLARAQRYLEAHPKGAFTDEVRRAWDVEEPRFFERAQESREGVCRYLADLPRGPHAAAAVALLVAFESSLKDAELADIARRVRFEDTKLERAAAQRRAVGEAILGAIGVLLDADSYGVPRSEGPPALKKLLLGRETSTWGGVPARREEDYFFLLPTGSGRESRVLTLEIGVVEKEGVVVGASVEGADLLVRWAEADQIVRLDPTSGDDRTEAQVHAMDRLGGALERRFPAASCPDARQGRELYHRACGGWEVVVVTGERAGDKDSIVIGAPARAK